MSALVQPWSFGDVSSMSDLPESGHSWTTYDRPGGAASGFAKGLEYGCRVADCAGHHLAHKTVRPLRSPRGAAIGDEPVQLEHDRNGRLFTIAGFSRRS